MKLLSILVGPPGSGKSTLAKTIPGVRISQDDQGKMGHLAEFKATLELGQDIVVDRMNFDREQRARYIGAAKEHGYRTVITVLHESMFTCLERMSKREDHPTIKDMHAARNALNFFFSKYTRPTEDEADSIVFKYPLGLKPQAVVCDLDGTLCNIDHRLKFVHRPADLALDAPWKKDWKSFSESCVTDTPNQWCLDLLYGLSRGTGLQVVFASGRSDEYRPHTEEWLEKRGVKDYGPLFMRLRNDYRQDCIVKENILDFEILTRFTPVMFIDDRKQVVDMWRRRGFTCLQCAEGEF